MVRPLHSRGPTGVSLIELLNPGQRVQIRGSSMRTFVLGDGSKITLQLRDLLLGEGHECSVSNLVQGGMLASRLAEANADIVLVVLSPDPEPALAALKALRGTRCGRKWAVG